MAQRSRQGGKQKGAGGDVVLGQQVLRRMQPLVSGWSREWLADDARSVLPRHFRMLALSPALSLPRVAPGSVADLSELLAPRATPMALNARFAAAGLGEERRAGTSAEIEARPYFTPTLEAARPGEMAAPDAQAAEVQPGDWQGEPLQELVTDEATAALEIPYEMLARYQEGWDAVEADAPFAALDESPGGANVESRPQPRRRAQASGATTPMRPSSAPARVQQSTPTQAEQNSTARMRTVARSAQGAPQAVRSAQPATIQPASMPLAYSPSEQYSRLLAERIRRAQGRPQPQQVAPSQADAQQMTAQGQIPGAQQAAQQQPVQQQAVQQQSPQQPGQQQAPQQQQGPAPSRPAQQQSAQWDARKSKASAIAERIEQAALARERGEDAPVYNEASAASAASVMDQRLKEGMRKQLAEREGVDPATLSDAATVVRKPSGAEAAKRAERWRAFSRVEVLSTATPAPAEEGVLPKAAPPRPEDRAAIQGVSSRPVAQPADEGEHAVIDLGAVEVIDESAIETSAAQGMGEVAPAGEFNEDGDLIDAEYEVRGATEYAPPTYEASPVAEAGVESAASGEGEFEDFEAMLAAMEEGDGAEGADVQSGVATPASVSTAAAAPGDLALSEPLQTRPAPAIDAAAEPSVNAQAARAESAAASQPVPQSEAKPTASKGRGKGSKSKGRAAVEVETAALAQTTAPVAQDSVESGPAAALPTTQAARESAAVTPTPLSSPLDAAVDGVAAAEGAPEVAMSSVQAPNAAIEETSATGAQDGDATTLAAKAELPARTGGSDVSADQVQVTTPVSVPLAEQAAQETLATQTPGPDAESTREARPTPSQPAQDQRAPGESQITGAESVTASTSTDGSVAAVAARSASQAETTPAPRDGALPSAVSTAAQRAAAPAATQGKVAQRAATDTGSEIEDAPGDAVVAGLEQSENPGAPDAPALDAGADVGANLAQAEQPAQSGSTSRLTVPLEGYEKVTQPTQPVRVKPMRRVQAAAPDQGEAALLELPSADDGVVRADAPVADMNAASASSVSGEDTVLSDNATAAAPFEASGESIVSSANPAGVAEGVQAANAASQPQSAQYAAASATPQPVQRQPAMQDDLPLARPFTPAVDAFYAEQAANAAAGQFSAPGQEGAPTAAPLAGEQSPSAPATLPNDPGAPQTELEAWVRRSLEALFAEGGTVAPPEDELGKQALDYIDALRHEAMAERALTGQSAAPTTQPSLRPEESGQAAPQSDISVSPDRGGVREAGSAARGADVANAPANESATATGRAPGATAARAQRGASPAMQARATATVAASAPVGVIQRTPADDALDEWQGDSEIAGALQVGRAETLASGRTAAQRVDGAASQLQQSNGASGARQIARSPALPRVDLDTPAAFANPAENASFDDMPLVHHRRNGLPRPNMQGSPAPSPSASDLPLPGSGSPSPTVSSPIAAEATPPDQSSFGARESEGQSVWGRSTGSAGNKAAPRQTAAQSTGQSTAQPAQQAVSRKVPDSVVRQAYGIAPPAASPPAISRVASNVVQATSVEVVQRAEGDDAGGSTNANNEVRSTTNLAEIARMVYPLLKDMLRLERDRFGR